MTGEIYLKNCKLYYNNNNYIKIIFLGGGVDKKLYIICFIMIISNILKGNIYLYFEKIYIYIIFD